MLDPVDRPVLSEYHAQGMVDGGFMLKSGPWKYCYYGAGQRPQVFNLDADPHEFHDQSTNNTQTAKLDAQLRTILDPANQPDRQIKPGRPSAPPLAIGA